MRKTGECFWRDGYGALWLAESFQDDDWLVMTTQTLVEEPATTEE